MRREWPTLHFLRLCHSLLDHRNLTSCRLGKERDCSQSLTATFFIRKGLIVLSKAASSSAACLTGTQKYRAGVEGEMSKEKSLNPLVPKGSPFDK